jgi:amino acid permease
MLLCTVQALGELAVLYPVNGAFFAYMVRFIDPSWYDTPFRHVRFLNWGCNVEPRTNFE